MNNKDVDLLIKSGKLIEDKDSSLEYILENYQDVGQMHSFLLKCTDMIGNTFYGKLDVEIGFSEQLDEHCDQCFNEIISWLRFRGDNKKCYVYLFGSVGLKKYNYFKDKNELNIILGDYVKIIDVIV